MNPNGALYTIGHSHHPIETFITLLRAQGITCLVDVRSQPYSRWSPQFNRETLTRSLSQAGLSYHWMGDMLGGRPADPSLYEAGQERPDYARLEQTPAYQKGIEQLIELAQHEPTAIMCSEGDHHQCHRFLLLTPTLTARGMWVQHIQPDGRIATEHPIAEQLTLF